RDGIDTFDRRNATPVASIQNDAARGEPLPADGNRETVAVAPGEASVFAHERKAVGILKQPLEVCNGLCNDPFRPLQHRLEIDTDRWNANAVFAGVARNVRDARRGESRLRRRATEIHARSAEVLALRQCNALARMDECARQWRSRLSCTDDENVVIRCHDSLPGNRIMERATSRRVASAGPEARENIVATRQVEVSVARMLHARPGDERAATHTAMRVKPRLRIIAIRVG